MVLKRDCVAAERVATNTPSSCATNRVRGSSFISQRFHEERQQERATERSREGHSGTTPNAKKIRSWPTVGHDQIGRIFPSSQAKMEGEPLTEVTQKKIIKALYTRVASELKLCTFPWRANRWGTVQWNKVLTNASRCIRLKKQTEWLS